MLDLFSIIQKLLGRYVYNIYLCTHKTFLFFMKKQTIAIHTPYTRPDTYGSLSVPIYSNVSFEFKDAQTMSDAFCNRIKAPDYSRISNPTVTNFEQRVKALTESHARNSVQLWHGGYQYSTISFGYTWQEHSDITPFVWQHTTGGVKRNCTGTEIKSQVDWQVRFVFLTVRLWIKKNTYENYNYGKKC